jgi:hypothetical protein
MGEHSPVPRDLKQTGLGNEPKARANFRPLRLVGRVHVLRVGLHGRLIARGGLLLVARTTDDSSKDAGGNGS